MLRSSRLASRALTHALACTSKSAAESAPTRANVRAAAATGRRRWEPESRGGWRGQSSSSDPHLHGWSPYKGFADTANDDMGFVEVDLSMVPRPVASGPASATIDRDGDPTFASVDFGSVRHYRIEVTTAAVRGAGTSGSVEITFIGDQGVSPPISLEYATGFTPRFERGTTLPFRVTSYMDPGRLSQVQVRLIPEMSQVGHGWLLENVKVTNEETGDVSHFNSRKWFGESDCGGRDGPLSQLLAMDVCPGKRERGETRADLPVVNLTVSAAGATVPHVDKTKEGIRAVMQREWGHGGEDAYFFKSSKIEGEKNVVAFGVADGVYMWRWQGIDAGEFSRRLMGLASEVFSGFTEVKSESNEHKFEKNRPEHLLKAAYAGVREEGVQGSTTACIATIDQTHGLLRSANVGDSGFMIVRGDPGNRGVCHRSPHQEHEFGRPFQLGHHANSDTPEDAMLTAFPLEPGDIVVMGSDGLWDNLSEIEILEVIESVFQGSSASAGLGAESQGVMNRASRELVSAAYTASMDKRRTTPYSLAATEWFDMVYSGGKKDDITAVVVNVG